MLSGVEIYGPSNAKTENCKIGPILDGRWNKKELVILHIGPVNCDARMGTTVIVRYFTTSVAVSKFRKLKKKKRNPLQ